jgi:hypothetical protein
MLVRGSIVLLIIALIGGIWFYGQVLKEDRVPETAGPPLSMPLDPAKTLPPASPTAVPLASPEPDVVRLLENAMSTSAAEQTYHFVMERTVSAQASAAEPTMNISVTGQHHAPDRIKGTVVLFSAGESATFDFIIIGNALYLRNHKESTWQQQDLESLAAQIIFENALLPVVQFSRETPSNPILVGEPQLHGLEVYHLRGVVLGNSEREHRPAAGTIDFWISKEDERIYRIKSEIEAARDDDLAGTDRSQLQIDYAAYGTPVLIAAPQLAEAGTFQPIDALISAIDRGTVPGRAGEPSSPSRVAHSDLLQQQ